MLGGICARWVQQTYVPLYGICGIRAIVHWCMWMGYVPTSTHSVALCLWSLSCLESVQQGLKIISISGEHGSYEEPAWILGGGGTSRNTWLCNFPRPGALRKCLMSFVNVGTNVCPSKLVVLNSLWPCDRKWVHACFSVYKTKIKTNRTPEAPNYGRIHEKCLHARRDTNANGAIVTLTLVQCL